MKRFEHVLQLRLTRDDLAFLQRMASAQRCTVEELIRKELCLSDPDAPTPQTTAHRPQLRLIADEQNGLPESA